MVLSFAADTIASLGIGFVSGWMSFTTVDWAPESHINVVWFVPLISWG